MEENSFKIIIIVVMIVMLASTAVILAYQSGALVLEGGVYLGSVRIDVTSQMFGIPLNLTVRLSNPLNRTVTVYYKVQSSPTELANYVLVENKGYNRVSPLTEIWGFITVTVQACPYTGTVSVIALGR